MEESTPPSRLYVASGIQANARVREHLQQLAQNRNSWNPSTIAGVDFNVYQTVAMKTAPDLSRLDALLSSALGLTGEAGEFADLIKKAVFHGHELNSAERGKLKKELGDILWYVALGCSALEVGMGVVAQENLNKLAKRYPEGFDPNRSINRGNL